MTEQVPLQPPARARAWIGRALARHPAGSAIVGDLLEDFHELARRGGARRAKLWFWREAVTLGLGYWLMPTHSRLETPAHVPETSTMLEALAPQGIASDVRQAARSLRRDPRLVAFSTLITAIGVGATTAVFSVLNPLLLQPLPFEHPDRLVWIANDAGEGRSGVTSRSSNLRDFREMSTSFDTIAGYNAFFEQGTYTLTEQGEPERLAGVGITDGFLTVLGVQPMLGRDFTAAESARWDDSAIILSHGFWQRRFAGDRSIVGQALTINGAPSTVVGVLPPSFDFASVFSPSTRVDLLTTFPVDDVTDRWGNTLSMVGRLAPGVELETARAEMAVVLERLQTADLERWGLDAVLMPLREVISGDHRMALLLLFGASAAVLLIVCVNLSSLLLSKGIRRRKEMFLRAALGARRGRLLRLMMLESLMLAAGGAILGIALAYGITRVVATKSMVAIPLLSSVRLDVWALAFSCLVALVAGLTVGVLPALQASGSGAAGALRSASRSLTPSRRSRWLREGLVVAEVAVAGALLVVGALLLQSFSNVLKVDLGFQPAKLAAWLIESDRRFENQDERSGFYEAVADAVRAVPGVEAVGLTDAIPLGINRQWGLGIAGRDLQPDQRPVMFPHIIDRHYLETMGIALLTGRSFASTDTRESEAVAIINRTAAAGLFPGQEAVGQGLLLGEQVIRIVGVAEDVKHLALERGSGYQLYLPMTQSGDFGTLDLVARSSLPLSAMRASVADAMHSIAPTLPANDVRTLGSVVDRSVSPRRFTLFLLSGFAGTAVLLAALGIYGVLSYSVAERAREIAIRMALGESSRQVRFRVIGRTLALAGAGAVIGIVLSISASRLVASMLYGVEPTDLGTLAAIPLLLLVVATLAGLLPARRASKVEALSSLRST